ncbi:hypothetical protein NL108_008197, partial [Boleophthalmus pectinirostris]
WFFVNGSFYLRDTPELSWMESRQYCQERGADLIIINSDEEQDFAQTLRKLFWIGLSDREEEGVWRWVDSSQLTKSFWFSDEPNNFNNDEDCVEVMMINDAPLNSWNDVSCGTKRTFICEM